MPTPPSPAPTRPRGFTLLELMVVLLIVALAAALLSQALPDRERSTLAREAERLAALLEAARAQSRASGVPVLWRPTAQGFAFDGLPPGATPLPGHWLEPGTQALGNAPVWLGPDPIIGAQTIVLQRSASSAPPLQVATDGLQAFRVQPWGLPPNAP